jgi:hypothetical protein
MRNKYEFGSRRLIGLDIFPGMIWSISYYFVGWFLVFKTLLLATQ